MRSFSLALNLAAALLLASFAYALSFGSRQIAPIAQPAAGFTPGSPVMIRIFKRESQFEVWMLKGDRFALYAVYPICYWSGRLGPKEREGDRQAPEGFYFVGVQQLHLIGRHPRSLNIGFPNAFDRASGRSGSYILVHGGCTSVGCFAMTDPVTCCNVRTNATCSRRALSPTRSGTRKSKMSRKKSKIDALIAGLRRFARAIVSRMHRRSRSLTSSDRSPST